jgi:hypothetical protein
MGIVGMGLIERRGGWARMMIAGICAVCCILSGCARQTEFTRAASAMSSGEEPDVPPVDPDTPPSPPTTGGGGPSSAALVCKGQVLAAGEHVVAISGEFDGHPGQCAGPVRACLGSCCIGSGYHACSHPDPAIAPQFAQTSGISPALCSVLETALLAVSANSPSFQLGGVSCSQLSVHNHFDMYAGGCSFASGDCRFTAP